MLDGFISLFVSFRLQPISLRSSKQLSLSYKLSLYKNRNVTLETIQSLPTFFFFFFTNTKTSPIHPKGLADIIKDLGLENKSPSWGNLHYFSVPSEVKVFYLVFSRNQGNSFKKGKGRGAVLKTRPLKKILKVSSTNISKKLQSSEQKTLTYSICQKHNLDATVLL